MAPPLIEHTTKVLDVGVKNLKIVVRQARPSSNNDFIVTDGSGTRDVAGFFGNASAGIAEDSFYVATRKINVALGDNVYIKGSAGALATIVHIK